MFNGLLLYFCNTRSKIYLCLEAAVRNEWERTIVASFHLFSLENDGLVLSWASSPRGGSRFYLELALQVVDQSFILSWLSKWWIKVLSWTSSWTLQVVGQDFILNKLTSSPSGGSRFYLEQAHELSKWWVKVLSQTSSWALEVLGQGLGDRCLPLSWQIGMPLYQFHCDQRQRNLVYMFACLPLACQTSCDSQCRLYRSLQNNRKVGILPLVLEAVDWTFSLGAPMCMLCSLKIPQHLEIKQSR